MTRALADTVLELTQRPLDRWAVAATLESTGVRDVDARERYGKRDIFDLADEVYALCLAAEATIPAEEEEERPRFALARRYLRGGFFFIQVALQLGSLAFLGYGQWASLEFSGRQASVVGMALVLAFLLTGPTSQAIGYVGSFFSESGKHLLAARAVAAVFALGVALLLVGAALVVAANLPFGWYDNRSLGAGLVYFALVGWVSLTGALLYMLKQFAAMVVATVLGIAVVGLMLNQAGFGIYAAQWIGLGVSIAIETTWAAVAIARRRRSTTPELRLAKMPPLGVLGMLVTPYLIYGLAYFGLLFADRLAAWSAGAHGLPFTFRAPYEVGLDWALIAVVPALAMLEVTIYLFSQRLAAVASRYAIGSAAEHNRQLLHFRRRHSTYVLGLLVLGAAVTTGVLYLLAQGHATKVSALFSDAITLRVYVLGVVGYALLVCGLFNGVFLFSIGRPWYVVRAIVPGVAVAVAGSLALSRAFDYWAAAGGLVAGCAVFALLAAVTATRALRGVDYHYFAAY